MDKVIAKLKQIRVRYFAAGNTTILYLWREKASAPMHMLHLGFGIGCLIVPLIVNPFLPLMAFLPDCFNATGQNYTIPPTADPAPSTAFPTPSTAVPTTNLTSTDFINCSIDDIESAFVLEDSLAEYAYAIVAIPTLFLAFTFMIFQCILPPVHDISGTKIRKRKSKAMLNPGSCTGGDWGYGIVLFSFVFLYFVFAVGFERFYSKFIRTYAVDELNFTKDEGSYVNSGFWVAFSLGRFFGFAFGKCISIRLMLVCEFCGVFLSALGLNLATYFAVHPEVTFWIFSLLIGLFLGPMWPTGIYWTDYHVELSGMGITVICLAGGCGGFSCVSAMGYIYEAISHVCFVYEAMVCGLALLILGICLTFVGIRHGSRFNKITEEEIVLSENIDNNKM